MSDEKHSYGRDTGEKVETLSDERNPATGHRKLHAGHSLPGKYEYNGGKPFKTGR